MIAIRHKSMHINSMLPITSCFVLGISFQISPNPPKVMINI